MRDLDELLEALHTGEPAARRLAALKLGAMRNPLVAPELVRAADTPDASLRTLIASALAALGDVALVRPALAHRRVYVRLMGVAALRHIDGPEATEALRGCLDDPDAEVRGGATEALRARGGPAS